MTRRRAIVLLLIVLAGALARWSLDRDRELARSRPLRHVGSEACARCHGDEAAAWRTSNHARAMQRASSTTPGFDRRELVTAEGTWRFFQTSGVPAVQIPTDAGPITLAVTHTLGVEPLQQLLVALDGGRLQALTVAWNVRDGGWLDLREDVAWNEPAYTWNARCAECHVTNLRQHWSADAGAYATTFSELGVGCEACHGPGSEHVEWATGRGRGDPGHGLVANPARTDGGWAFSGGPIAKRTAPASETAVEACAPCHARRTAIAPAKVSAPFADSFELTLLDEGVYFADGQLEDESFEYGSFLQSRMHARGVACADCHEPHSGKLRAPGNQLCAQCHASATFDRREHTMHAADTEAARCVTCHMPSRVFMRIDERHDHGFRIPRRSVSGSPDVCARCHTTSDAGLPSSWALALEAGRGWKAGAPELLVQAAGDAAVPAIARATALTLLARWPQNGRAIALASAHDTNPLVRAAACEVLGLVDDDSARAVLTELTLDRAKAVRLRATRALGARAPLPTMVELRAALELHADEASGLTALAELDVELSDLAGAETRLRRAIELDPRHVPAIVNLADVLRAGGADDEGERFLSAALARMPDAALFESLGLLRIRQGKRAEALVLLERAALARPEDPRLQWLVALSSDEHQQERLIRDIRARFPAFPLSAP